jgi:hypothetical protein
MFKKEANTVVFAIDVLKYLIIIAFELTTVSEKRIIDFFTN